jgi:hypothetical protein
MQYFKEYIYKRVLLKDIKNEIQEDRQSMCNVILKRLGATLERQ